jgi:penicillin-binding protein 1A
MSTLVGFCALVLAALVAVGWVVAVADSAPNLTELTPHGSHQPSMVYASDGTLLGYIHGNDVSVPVASDRLPWLLKRATIAIEDRRFYQHGALDYEGILRAGIKDLFGGSGSLQGASTLTMQLVNNMYLDGTKYAADHDLKYKIIQAKLAEQLQSKHSRAWVLDTYLNSVPYGTVGGVTAYGVGAASKIFFDKPVWKLDLAQMALLAGLPQAPSNYNPFLDPGLAKARRTAVLQAMRNAHWITARQAHRAENAGLQVHANTSYGVEREAFVFNYVEQQLIQRFGLNTVQNGGLKVYTTINLKMQRDARAAIMAHEPGGPHLDDQPAAALATVDPANGHILALAQSAPFTQTNFDYPVQAERQTGSAFKVFALMTLIHDYDGDPNLTYYTSKPLGAGWDPQEPTWSVHTAEDSYQGTINLTKATILSDNTVFAQLVLDLGPKKMDAIAHAMGITSPLDGNPAEVIGGLADCCTMLEMADAYATIANGGTHYPATIVDKVVFPDGSTVNMGDATGHRVFSDGETYAATKVLEGVIQSGTGTAADYGCPAAGKTGTAENYDNAWFVGYTPHLSTAVWVGYPQANIQMVDGFGGALAAPIWHDFMLSASSGYCGDFALPTTYWTGTAFYGPHSASKSAPVTVPGSGKKSGSPYNNATLFSQGQSTGGGTAAPPGGGAPSGGATPPGQGGGAAPGPGNGNGNGHSQSDGGGGGGH